MMLPAARSVGSLLAAIFVMMMGAGALATLISLDLRAGAASAFPAGLAATAYFTGLMIGSFTVFSIVARVGHIRAFAAFVSLFSATALVYAIHLDLGLWSMLRLIEGYCMAGVFVCIESWLNERAEPGNRGRILAFYMIALYAGQAVGQFLLNLGERSPAMPFIAASILLSLSVIPVVLTRIPAPIEPASTPMGLAALYRVSPLGVIGAIATGAMLGAFYGLGAIFARGVGLDVAATALFMSVTIIGGVVLQWPLGRASDRFDRRRVIVATLAATLVITTVLAGFGDGRLLLLGAGALFGGASFALYPLCVAHTNDHLQPGERVGASGGLVLAYSLGAALGPLSGAAMMMILGPRGLFGFIAFCAGLALLFALWRLKISPPIPGSLQNPYQLLPRTTPGIAVLDPLADPQQP